MPSGERRLQSSQLRWILPCLGAINLFLVVIRAPGLLTTDPMWLSVVSAIAVFLVLTPGLLASVEAAVEQLSRASLLNPSNIRRFHRSVLRTTSSHRLHVLRLVSVPIAYLAAWLIVVDETGDLHPVFFGKSVEHFGLGYTMVTVYQIAAAPFVAEAVARVFLAGRGLSIVVGGAKDVVYGHVDGMGGWSPVAQPLLRLGLLGFLPLVVLGPWIFILWTSAGVELLSRYDDLVRYERYRVPFVCLLAGLLGLAYVAVAVPLIRVHRHLSERRERAIEAVHLSAQGMAVDLDLLTSLTAEANASSLTELADRIDAFDRLRSRAVRLRTWPLDTSRAVGIMIAAQALPAVSALFGIAQAVRDL